MRIKNNKTVAVGVRYNRLFKLLIKVVKNNIVANTVVREPETLNIWHEKLCHQNIVKVKKFLNNSGIRFIENENFFCEACIYGKHHRSVFVSSKNPGELIHTDVCGPMENLSIGGCKYFILFKDDFTNYRHVYFLEEKSDVYSVIDNFIKTVKRDTHLKIKCMRSDNGTEYINKEVQNLLLDNGIQHQKTVPYTPEQNGRAERDMRTVVEAARSMIHSRGLNKKTLG